MPLSRGDIALIAQERGYSSKAAMLRHLMFTLGSVARVAEELGATYSTIRDAISAEHMKEVALLVQTWTAYDFPPEGPLNFIYQRVNGTLEEAQRRDAPCSIPIIARARDGGFVKTCFCFERFHEDRLAAAADEFTAHTGHVVIQWFNGDRWVNFRNFEPKK